MILTLLSCVNVTLIFKLKILAKLQMKGRNNEQIGSPSSSFRGTIMMWPVNLTSLGAVKVLPRSTRQK